MLKGLLVGAGVFLAGLLLGGVLLAKPGVVTGGASTDHPFFESFQGGVVLGGPLLTLTATGTAVTAAQVCDNAVVHVAVTNGGAIGNLTLPTAPSVFGQCLGNLGDSKTLFFRNTSSSGSFTLLAGGGSSTVQMLSVSTGTNNYVPSTSTVTAGDSAKVTFFRSTSGSQPWLYQVVELFR